MKYVFDEVIDRKPTRGRSFGRFLLWFYHWYPIPL